ncbi:putative lactoylglutathione lyase GloA [Methyloglobulus morosus KoM1]|uniref:lactoylglutathione lyase n=1 Tax=Methyloglobulus morosus KoM1 TaxID=1116472 RepID=V5E0U8_9GAMM|nr:lactoylglutathione lyase [Methyloglobulus morosus]ESS73176.1 putative lactoylglutathione lyase GloA [Methyloglobulus morosus KoM1]
MNPNIYPTRLLHTMLRVGNLDKSIAFYTQLLGMKLLHSQEYPEGEYTLAFVGYQDEADSTVLELTYNWGKQHYDIGTAFGHLALATDDIYATCEALAAEGVNITRPPGPMKDDASIVIAFLEDPDGYKIELIQRK